MTVKECPFCNQSELPIRTIVASELFLAIYPRNPLNQGHTLIITKKHRENFLQLSNQESGALVKFTKKVCKHLRSELHNQGFNIFTNVGSKAGQTVEHFHLHILPRFQKKISPLSKNQKI